jgi:catechol 2,3-dioxygenase-like lactoylglutathione lyase family enzyme
VLHHITIWVPDLERADESWSWLLGELDYRRDDSRDHVLLFRHPIGFTVALEQSDDMVPGMLHSRLRPGMNHLAFAVQSEQVLQRVLGDADAHGWARLSYDLHPLASTAHVAYLEDRDGFEVELVVAMS